MKAVHICWFILGNIWMLYVILKENRIDQIKTLLRPVSEEDVPRRLIEDIENNKKIEEERVYCYLLDIFQQFFSVKKERISSRCTSLHLSFCKS